MYECIEDRGFEQDGWRMVLRGTSGNGQSVYHAWIDGTFHRNSRTGPQIAANIFDRATVFKNVSATSKYLLVLSEYMASKIYYQLNPVCLF
jgi:hypothetical protein